MWSCGSEWAISSAARCFSAPTIRAEEAAGASELFHLTGSKPEDIDVVMTVDEADLEAMSRALDCYVAYAATVEAHLDGPGIKRHMSRKAAFELYQEPHDPPLEGLFDGLTVKQG